MKTTLASAFVSLALASTAIPAEIQRISQGGLEITVDDLVPEQMPAVVVFHTPWDQSSITLVGELESWAADRPALHIILVDVVDERTQVYRQFGLKGIPCMMVYDRDHKLMETVFDNIEDLEAFLEDEDVL